MADRWVSTFVERLGGARIGTTFNFYREGAGAERRRLRLLEYLESQREHFAASPESPAQVAPSKSGESNAAETAAWTMVARVLLNLDEFITRE